MNALTQEDRRCLDRVRERHQHDATLRDIDHATPEWLTHTDRRNLLAIIDRLTSCDAAQPKLYRCINCKRELEQSETERTSWALKCVYCNNGCVKMDAAQVREGGADPEGDAILAEVARGFDKPPAPQAEGAVAVCRLCHEEATAHCTRSQCPHVTPAPTLQADTAHHAESRAAPDTHGGIGVGQKSLPPVGPAPTEAAWPSHWKEAVLAAPYAGDTDADAAAVLGALDRVGALKRPMDRTKLVQFLRANIWISSAIYGALTDALIAADAKGELSKVLP